MAIQTRKYLSVAITPASIGRFIGPTASIVAQTGAFVTIQYDDATISADTLDGVMAQIGYVFNASADTLLDLPTELKDEIFLPEGPTAGNSIRALATTYVGASFILRRPMTFDRVVARFTAFTAPGTVSLLLFQAMAGAAGEGPLPRVATVAGFSPGATPVNVEMPLSEGTVTLRSGLVYVLMGRDSAAGSCTIRTRTVTAMDLLNNNVDVNTHPTTFTTAIAVPAFPGAPPATFDPRQTPTGQATGDPGDVVPVIRLYKT